MLSDLTIVVCGCIGAGKSTTVRRLGAATGMYGRVEEYGRNPLLGAFYRDPSRWAFHSQLWFLLDALAPSEIVVGRGTIRESDARIATDVIGAELHDRGYISPEEMQILKSVSARAKPVDPDLYLLLEADADTLLRRIADRGRQFERAIDRGYLEALSDRYRRVLKEIPVKSLVVSTTELDIREQLGLSTVLELVKNAIDTARSDLWQQTDQAATS